MNSNSKYEDTEYGWIGIKPTILLESGKAESIKDRYATFDIKRLTKANSFTACGEVFHIGKKDADGKATKIYHVVRVSDKRYVCPSARDKDETIRFVQRKYIEMDLCREGSSLF